MSTFLKRNSTVGLDYGTHSTKVVHRIRDEYYGYVLNFDRSCKGYPVNASPSVVRRIGESLYFGTQAVERLGGTDYGSLKAKLIGSKGDHKLDQADDVLAAAYIAWVLGECLAADKQLATDDPILQVSAPMCDLTNKRKGDSDQLPNVKIQERFLRIVHASYACIKAFGRIEQGIDFTKVANYLGSVLSQKVPGREERRFFVEPETVAPIISLQREPIIESGIHLIVDMGAATTEMSICGVNNESNDNRILGYSNSTESRGGNDLAEFEGMAVGRSQRKLEEFLAKLKSQAHRVWQLGYLKDNPTRARLKQWMRLQILLTGGATHDKNVRQHFEEDINPILAWPRSESERRIGRHVPSTLKCQTGFEEQDLSLFAVANGLSVYRRLWPEFDLASEITPMDSESQPEVPLIPSYLEMG